MKTIRKLRQERGWTQFELARRVGVLPQAVRLWESGRAAPPAAHLRRLAGVFDLRGDGAGSATGAMGSRPPRRQDRPPGRSAEL